MYKYPRLYIFGAHLYYFLNFLSLFYTDFTCYQFESFLRFSFGKQYCAFFLSMPSQHKTSQIRILGLRCSLSSKFAFKKTAITFASKRKHNSLFSLILPFYGLSSFILASLVLLCIYSFIEYSNYLFLYLLRIFQLMFLLYQIKKVSDGVT